MTGERENKQLSEFLLFLAQTGADGERVPSLAVLSQQLNVSIASLREQLEVARALGLVEVRPKTGIRRLPFQFKPAVLKSLTYAAVLDKDFYFPAFANLRMHVEAAYWQEGVACLTPEDRVRLRELVSLAFDKLNGPAIQNPHAEHKELHLLIYRRLENPFVMGILEAYWEAYEAVGLSIVADIRYLKNVWEYHRRMVESICAGDINGGYHTLLEHTDLLQQREAPMPKPVLPRQGFE
jgi:DNA-binding FadR family transcriptional regulator